MIDLTGNIYLERCENFLVTKIIDRSVSFCYHSFMDTKETLLQAALKGFCN